MADRSPSGQPRATQPPVIRTAPAKKPATRVPVQERTQSQTATRVAKSVTKTLPVSPAKDRVSQAREAPPASPKVRGYTVRRGDTLYSIAWRFELDPQGLAYANNIDVPYTIFPGQQLRLIERAVVKSPRPEPKRTNKPSSAASAGALARSPSVLPNKPVEQSNSWQWPMTLAPTAGYTAARKGVDFELRPGRKGEVLASSGGKVVYAGNGIGGYEQLIIIKHTDNLLSAYSFNGKNRVREQVTVKVGQKIADILPVGRTIPKLHFEIRKDGEPINPGTYISR